MGRYVRAMNASLWGEQSRKSDLDLNSAEISKALSEPRVQREISLYVAPLRRIGKGIEVAYVIDRGFIAQ